MTQMNRDALNEYSDDKRLDIYKILIAACTHLYSKGKLQKDKFDKVVPIFADLSKNDPIFMAHLAAWAAKQNSKDLRVLATYFNALNDADGTPFFKGSSLNKPDYRKVSAALIQDMDPHLANRVLELAGIRFGVPGLFNDAVHMPTSLKTAFQKYLRYREMNPYILEGIKKKGMSKKLQNMFRRARLAPSDVTVETLGWKQKDGRVPSGSTSLPDFSAMTGAEIADYLEAEKLSTLVAMSIVPKEKITASVAKAMLKNATGNQAVILYNFFRREGFLEVASISNLFGKKIREATTAVDRVETLTKNATESDKKELAGVRSESRKAEYRKASIGKIYLHLDISSSMQSVVEWAKNHAATVAECVDNPSENFGWGVFNNVGLNLPIPSDFTKEGFHQALFGVRAGGMTDCLACYGYARRMGAEVDVYVTDEGHNVGSVKARIEKFHADNPDLPMPKAAVIVQFDRRGQHDGLGEQLMNTGIPVSYMQPDALVESAGVSRAVTTAIKGQLVVIEEIMSTPLPELPHWWNGVNVKKKVTLKREPERV